LKNVHKLTEGAILLAVFTVLLLITLYVPILGTVVNFFLPAPFIMFAAKGRRKDSFVFFVAATILSLIVGSLLAIPLTVAYGLTGWVIGDFIRTKKSRRSTLIAGSIAFLFNLVIQYVIAVAFFKINFIEDSMKMLRESIDQSISILSAIGQTPNEAILNQFNQAIDLIQSLMPTIFVLISFLIVYIIQLVTFPIIKRFGVNVEKSEPFRNLSLPKSLFYYYIILLLVSILFQPEINTFVHIALSNILFILQLLLIVQGLSFVWFYSHLKSWSKAIPISLTIFLFIIPIILYIVMILGIIDLGLDWRKKLLKN
jgi:uncharacterized protein YybS (DUF2232 family)